MRADACMVQNYQFTAIIGLSIAGDYYDGTFYDI
jgi:hypothetical protein